MVVLGCATSKNDGGYVGVAGSWSQRWSSYKSARSVVVAPPDGHLSCTPRVTRGILETATVKVASGALAALACTLNCTSACPPVTITTATPLASVTAWSRDNVEPAGSPKMEKRTIWPLTGIELTSS